jgi:hypothetical protein
MKLRSAWIKNICLTMFGLVLLTSGLQAAEARQIVIVPMQLQQGSLVSLKIPQFDAGMSSESMAMFNEQLRQTVMQHLRKFEPVVYETRRVPQLPVSVKNAMTFTADYEVFRSDERIVSITQLIYQFTGGAHGMSLLIGYTIDLVNERRMQLPHLFAAGTNYPERLNWFIREEGAKRKLPMWEFKGIDDDSAFYLNDEGIVLFFQQYEIAPYSEGIIRMLIPYSRVADILRSEILR